jgi:5'(3')-deoxyribonucleotidase
MSPNNKNSYYQFNDEETNFFKQLSKQPYYEKAIADIQQDLNITLTTNNINLTKIISTIITK